MGTRSVWAIRRFNYYYYTSAVAPYDDYLRDSDGMVIAVTSRAVAFRLARELAQRDAPYYSAHGEYSPPTYEPRRIRFNNHYTRTTSEAQARSLLLGIRE